MKNKNNEMKKMKEKKRRRKKDILMEVFGKSLVMEMMEVKMFQKKYTHVATEYVRI